MPACFHTLTRFICIAALMAGCILPPAPIVPAGATGNRVAEGAGSWRPAAALLLPAPDRSIAEARLTPRVPAVLTSADQALRPSLFSRADNTISGLHRRGDDALLTLHCLFTV